MNTVNIEKIAEISLPKREVRVLVGSGSPISSNCMTFGVCTVPPTTKMDPHTHSREEEIIYVLSGHGYVEIDGTKEKIKTGSVIKISKGSSHIMCNESDEDMNFTFCFNPPVEIGSYDKN